MRKNFRADTYMMENLGRNISYLNLFQSLYQRHRERYPNHQIERNVAIIFSWQYLISRSQLSSHRCKRRFRMFTMSTPWCIEHDQCFTRWPNNRIECAGCQHTNMFVTRCRIFPELDRICGWWCRLHFFRFFFWILHELGKSVFLNPISLLHWFSLPIKSFTVLSDS